MKGVKINHIGGNLGDIVEFQPPGAVNENAQLPGDNLLGDALKLQDPLKLRLCEKYRVEFNTI